MSVNNTIYLDIVNNVREKIANDCDTAVEIQLLISNMHVESGSSFMHGIVLEALDEMGLVNIDLTL